MYILLLALLFLTIQLAEAGKLLLTEQPKYSPFPSKFQGWKLTRTRLATLFTKASFKGDYFTVSGIYGSCYDIVQKGEYRSITLDDETEHCDVWGVRGCGGFGDGLSFPFLLFRFPL